MIYRKILKLMGRRAKGDSIYLLRDINASSIDEYHSGISDIYKGKIDGFIIRNVLSQDQIDLIIRGIQSPLSKKFRKASEGVLAYPEPFSMVARQFDNTSDLKNYYRARIRVWNEITKEVGFDLVESMRSLLQKLARDSKVIPPPGIDGEGMCNPMTIKQLIPGVGNLTPHCGNGFSKDFPNFFGHLTEISDIMDQLSYFVMLQPAHKGGDLILYDIKWKNARQKLSNERILRDRKGKDWDLEDPAKVSSMVISPNAGDMIVFAGGQIWHKVSHVFGARPRITMGGFISLIRDETGYYFWS